MSVEVPDKTKGAGEGWEECAAPWRWRLRTAAATEAATPGCPGAPFSCKRSQRVPLACLSQKGPSGNGGCPTGVGIGGMRLVMHVPTFPGPLTCLHPHALQINRPPVKLNLLTCQVRPHTEEKKCFDLVTRECPEGDAMAGVGVFVPEAAELRMGTPFLEKNILSGFSHSTAPGHLLPF